MEKLDDGESNWVGTPGGTSREDAMGAIVDGRRTQQFESFGAIEDPQNDEVRETFDVGEAGFKLRQDFEDAFRVVFGVETFRDLLGGFVGSFGVTDWLRRKHRVSMRPSMFGQQSVARVIRNNESLILSSCVPRGEIDVVTYFSKSLPMIDKTLGSEMQRHWKIKASHDANKLL
jgi:hypothetical protein